MKYLILTLFLSACTIATKEDHTSHLETIATAPFPETCYHAVEKAGYDALTSDAVCSSADFDGCARACIDDADDLMKEDRSEGISADEAGNIALNWFGQCYTACQEFDVPKSLPLPK